MKLKLLKIYDMLDVEHRGQNQEAQEAAQNL
jgi:hypothetical protein